MALRRIRSRWGALRTATHTILAAALASAVGCAEGGNSLSEAFANPRPLSLSLAGEPGEPWTIECLTDRTPQHTATVDRLADLMRRTRGIRSSNVKVVHENQVSTLYYGSYALRPDSSSRLRDPQMDRDMQLIRQLTLPDDPNRHPFAGARRVPEPNPNEGPPEWDVRRADATYSLQVAVFYNTEEFHERKKAAVEYCKYWRDKGYEAFYYHGPRLSSTTVGLFPEKVVKQVAGRPVYGDEVAAFQKKEPEFAWCLQNGQKIYLRRDGQRVAQSSYLVRIPKTTEPPDS